MTRRAASAQQFVPFAPFQAALRPRNLIQLQSNGKIKEFNFTHPKDPNVILNLHSHLETLKNISNVRLGEYEACQYRDEENDPPCNLSESEERINQLGT